MRQEMVRRSLTGACRGRSSAALATAAEARRQVPDEVSP